MQNKQTCTLVHATGDASEEGAGKKEKKKKKKSLAIESFIL